MAMACDFRIASENAKLGQPEILRGFFPGAGATYLLPRLIGKSRALELILTGDIIDAQEAYRLGLVNHIVPPGKLEIFVKELAHKIATKNLLVIKAVKEAITQAEGKDSRTGKSIAIALRALCESIDSPKERIRDFLEEKKSS